MSGIARSSRRRRHNSKPTHTHAKNGSQVCVMLSLDVNLESFVVTLYAGSSPKHGSKATGVRVETLPSEGIVVCFSLPNGRTRQVSYQDLNVNFITNAHRGQDLPPCYRMMMLQAWRELEYHTEYDRKCTLVSLLLRPSEGFIKIRSAWNTGVKNTGNTCYLASIAQALTTVAPSQLF